MSKYMGIYYPTMIYSILVGSVGYYAFWTLLHFLAAHLYVVFCVPPNLYGLMMSPFLVPTPHCTAFRWMISEGSQIVLTMWSMGGTCLIAYFVRGARGARGLSGREDIVPDKTRTADTK